MQSRCCGPACPPKPQKEKQLDFVFLLFVPQNVGEALRGADDASERLVLEQKVEVLTQRLEALESLSLPDNIKK